MNLFVMAGHFLFRMYYGKEFVEHETIAAKLKADICFAHPYHSWERGLNENSNGLLRQYFPKVMELTEVTEKRVR